MTEQETIQHAMREQYKVAESFAENVLRAWTDMATTTTQFAFDRFEKNLRYAQETRAQADQVVQETLTNYHRLYQEGLKSWQGYVQGINDILARSS